MTSTAQDAATAARQTRERKIRAAFRACVEDSEAARALMPEHPSELTHANVKAFVERVGACQFNGLDLLRLIAQRDGMPVSDGPDVNR